MNKSLAEIRAERLRAALAEGKKGKKGDACCSSCEVGEPCCGDDHDHKHESRAHGQRSLIEGRQRVPVSDASVQRCVLAISSKNPDMSIEEARAACQAQTIARKQRTESLTKRIVSAVVDRA